MLLDSLIEQVHAGAARADVLREGAELIEGDVRDLDTVARALRGVDAVVHLAAEVGVGQSMYAIARYVGVNDLGTAVLMEALARTPMRRVVVASSMSIYGEGLYRTAGGDMLQDVQRHPGADQGWDPRSPRGEPLEPLPTPEWKRPSLASVYALTKYAQERLTLITAPAYGMEACALRLFNVFGPGQALSNPYTGVLAIFASRLINGQPPLVFEDGQQQRDFVHVEDVAEAFVLALERPEAVGQVFNIGSGRRYTVLEVARRLAAEMGRADIEPTVLQQARVGDIRHCVADISRAHAELGFTPRRWLEDSLGELTEWVKSQRAVDRVEEARRELEQRGLVA